MKKKKGFLPIPLTAPRRRPAQVRAGQTRRVQAQSREALRRQLAEQERAARHARAELARSLKARAEILQASEEGRADLEKERERHVCVLDRLETVEASCADFTLLTQAVRPGVSLPGFLVPNFIQIV